MELKLVQAFGSWSKSFKDEKLKWVIWKVSGLTGILEDDLEV